MIVRRNIAVCIVLSIVTCGIYGLYWLVCLANDTNIACGDRNGTSGGMVLLFSIITCGIYLFYFMYKQGVKLEAAKGNPGGSASGSGILYLVLTFFGLSIVSYALMQDELNKLSDNRMNQNQTMYRQV